MSYIVKWNHMKDKIIITSSVAGLLALLVFHLAWGMHVESLSQHPRVLYDMFIAGFALAFLATVLAATSFVRHWRGKGVLARFVWAFAVLGGFAAMMAFGP